MGGGKTEEEKGKGVGGRKVGEGGEGHYKGIEEKRGEEGRRGREGGQRGRGRRKKGGEGVVGVKWGGGHRRGK